MKYFIYKTFLFVSLFFIFPLNPIFGQITINPFQVTPSTLFEDLLRFKSENPKISAEKLAEQANSLMQKKGLNFVFAFEQSVCQKITDAREKQKDKSQPVKLNAALKSVDAEAAKIVLPDVSFDKSECGRCFIQMPLFEFSGKDFVTSIEGRNIKFFTPSNFLFNEVVLVDGQNLSTIIRKWQVPFRTAPVSVSDDGKLLYLELPFSQLNELTLVVYDGGGFQFYAKNELDLTAKSSELKDISKESISPNTAFIKLTKGEKTQILKYNTVCQ
ncbi:hypothetical protein BH20ACI1_BH20ACI1_19720 [soil metagenome]